MHLIMTRVKMVHVATNTLASCVLNIKINKCNVNNILLIYNRTKIVGCYNGGLLIYLGRCSFMTGHVLTCLSILTNDYLNNHYSNYLLFIFILFCINYVHNIAPLFKKLCPKILMANNFLHLAC